MKTQYHREITIKALGAYFETGALEAVVTANLGQDALRFQIGHDHFHFDNNSFAAGNDYCEEQRLLVAAALQQRAGQPAREALGRLTHSVQDFYAHSNYVGLWCEGHPASSSDEIDPELDGLLHDPRLHSGKLYYPLEALSFIAALKPYVVPLLPRNSHAWMNIDSPGRTGFDYAFSAALKRTKAEYLRLASRFSTWEVALLTGNES